MRLFQSLLRPVFHQLSYVLWIHQHSTDLRGRVVRFGLRWLFALTAVVAVILCAYKADAGCAFVATLIGLPLLAAGFSRIHLKETHAVSLAAMYTSAMTISASTLAIQSCYLTFYTNSTGYLVGGGWLSVVGSAVLGLIIGVAVGVVDMLLYFVAQTFCVIARALSAPDRSV